MAGKAGMNDWCNKEVKSYICQDMHACMERVKFVESWSAEDVKYIGGYWFEHNVQSCA